VRALRGLRASGWKPRLIRLLPAFKSTENYLSLPLKCIIGNVSSDFPCSLVTDVNRDKLPLLDHFRFRHAPFLVAILELVTDVHDRPIGAVYDRVREIAFTSPTV